MTSGAHLVVVGPTASGKTALALELAERLGREVVSLDSMQVYRHMDVGTAKPTPAERGRIPHHLLDVVEPEEEWTVAEHRRAVDEVLADGRPTVLVGGTGLYVRAVVEDLDLPGRYPEVRRELEADPDTHGLHRRLERLDPTAATRMEPGNRRRVVRALEVTLGAGRPFSSFGPGLDRYPATPRFVVVGLAPSRAVLDRRIAERFDEQLRAGFLDEVRSLVGRLGRTASQALGYRELSSHLRGERTLDEAVDEAVRRTRRFARRQERWFRRDPRITWLDPTVVGGPAQLADRVLAAPR